MDRKEFMRLLEMKNKWDYEHRSAGSSYHTATWSTDRTPWYATDSTPWYAVDKWRELLDKESKGRDEWAAGPPPPEHEDELQAFKDDLKGAVTALADIIKELGSQVADMSKRISELEDEATAKGGT